jgi:hypothetical protein
MSLLVVQPSSFPDKQVPMQTPPVLNLAYRRRHHPCLLGEVLPEAEVDGAEDLVDVEVDEEVAGLDKPLRLHPERVVRLRKSILEATLANLSRG